MSKQALILDDDLSNRQLWEKMLAEHGYEVDSVASADEFSRRDSSATEMFLIDYYLPDVMGTEVVAHVRHNNPESLIMVVSMADDNDVIQINLEAGANVYLVKPATPTMMVQVLNEVESGEIGTHSRMLISNHGRRQYPT